MSYRSHISEGSHVIPCGLAEVIDQQQFGRSPHLSSSIYREQMAVLFSPHHQWFNIVYTSARHEKDACTPNTVSGLVSVWESACLVELVSHNGGASNVGHCARGIVKCDCVIDLKGMWYFNTHPPHTHHSPTTHSTTHPSPRTHHAPLTTHSPTTPTNPHTHPPPLTDLHEAPRRLGRIFKSHPTTESD